jgi:hypothetical protein
MIRQTKDGRWELYNGDRLIASTRCLESINAARRLLQEIAPPPESQPPFTLSRLDIE